MAAGEGNKPLVFDNGSRMTKAGFAGDDTPKISFRNVLVQTDGENVCVGDDTFPNLRSAISKGVVVNWDDMLEIWRHTYKKLGVASEYHPVLLTESSLNSNYNRERMMEVIFEDVNAPAMYVVIQAILSLYASRRTRGIVLECGDSVTQVVPIFEGHVQRHAMSRLHFAGSDITSFLMKKIGYEKHIMSAIPGEREKIFYDIKEKLGYVAIDYEKEISSTDPALLRRYKLPDGKAIITMGAECFTCPEILFQPNLSGRDYLGIHELVNKSIMKCATSVQKDMYENIVLSGGSTMFRGFASRMAKEISRLESDYTGKINVVARPNRNNGVWIGGSILASLSSFQQCWVSKEDYNESGSSIVFNKCFGV